MVGIGLPDYEPDPRLRRIAEATETTTETEDSNDDRDVTSYQ